MLDFKALSQGQKLSLILLSSLIVLAAVVLGYRLLNPQQVLIYQDPSLAMVSKVTDQLDLQGVDYQLDETGTGVLVAGDKANRVKVKLAQLNASETPLVGFELFDKVDYSMTEHAQQVTYQRALQGELERTLTSYQEVASARVHIMIPQRKLFALEQAKAKASVSLIFEPGSAMTVNQINGVQAVVAAAVEGLAEHDVIVLNGEGLKISTNEVASTTPGEPQNQGQQQLEQQLTEKAQRILSLYFEPDQIAVSVSAVLDYTQVKQVEKSLLTDSKEHGFVTRKKESEVYRAPTDGVPAVTPDKNTEIEYAHGSQTRETLSYAGSIKQLNVAIAIVAKIAQPELEKLRHLVTAGLGIESTRGDRLSVESFEPLVQTVATVNVQTPAPQVIPVQPVVTVDASLADGSDVGTVSLTILQQVLAVIAIALVLLSILLLAMGYRRKGLNEQQKQATLIQFDQWINDISAVKPTQSAKPVEADPYGH